MSKKSTNRKATEQVHMGPPPSEQAWWNGEKYILFKDMSLTYLQRAKMHTQKMQLIYYNKINKLYDLEQKLNAEAEKRGKELKDFPSELHRNNRILKQAMKKQEGE